MCGSSYNQSLRTPPASPVAAPSGVWSESDKVVTALLDQWPDLNKLPKGDLDFTRPIECLTDSDAEDRDDEDVNDPFNRYTIEIIRIRPGTDYQIVALVTGHGEDTLEQFDEHGNSDSTNYRLMNVKQKAGADDDVSEDAEPSTASVDLPPPLQKRVRHTKRGMGTVVKVRGVDPKGKGRLVLVRLDQAPPGKDRDVWALPANINWNATPSW